MRLAAEPVHALFDVAKAIAAASPAVAVDAAMAVIGPHFDADRVWLMRFDPALEQLWVAHEWCAQGVPAYLPDFPGVPISLIALPLIRLRSGKSVVYADIEQLPPDAQLLKEEMRREGNRATAGAPLLREGRLVALLGLDDIRKIHRWTNREMKLLGQLGELVLTAADRCHSASPATKEVRTPAPEGCYLRSGNSHIHVRWDEIVTIQSEGDYSRVRLQNGREFLELKGLAVWEAMLPARIFSRVHRSWIVGWKQVERVDRCSGGRWQLLLHDRRTVLPVGRHYQPEVKRQLILGAG
jgi:hypothetical protein